MAFNKATLKSELETGLKQIFDNPNISNNKDAIAVAMAQLFADKIDDYAKTGNAVGSDTGGDTHTLTLE
jgi:hypothetical protein